MLDASCLHRYLHQRIPCLKPQNAAGKCGGRKSYADQTETVAFAKELHAHACGCVKSALNWQRKAISRPAEDQPSPPQCNLCCDSQAAPLTAISRTFHRWFV